MRIRNPKKIILIVLALLAAGYFAVKKGLIPNPFNRG